NLASDNAELITWNSELQSEEHDPRFSRRQSVRTSTHESHKNTFGIEAAIWSGTLEEHTCILGSAVLLASHGEISRRHRRADGRADAESDGECTQQPSGY